MMDDVTLRVVKPLGRFHAVEHRDASALARDGETFYAANELQGSVPTWEVLFEDGTWMLAAPADLEWKGKSPALRFTLDALAEDGHPPSWEALRFGKRWNGWETPVVTREVLASILEQVRAETGEPHGWDGAVALISGPVDGDEEPEYFDRLEPSEDGTYDLALLGWTFIRLASTSAT